MLRKALNVHWSERMPNVTLYGKLPKIGDKIAARRLRLVGHCQRHPELGAHRLILWEPMVSEAEDDQEQHMSTN